MRTNVRKSGRGGGGRRRREEVDATYSSRLQIMLIHSRSPKPESKKLIKIPEIEQRSCVYPLQKSTLSQKYFEKPEAEQ
jgi:hypothetical protein